MHLLDLPDELLDICCSQIDTVTEPIDEDAWPTAAQVNLAALRNLRLTCKHVSPLASKHLFSRLTLFPTKASALKARSVLDDPCLNSLVNTICLPASLEENRDRGKSDDPPRPSWNIDQEDDPEWETNASGEEHAIDGDGELSATFKRMMGDIGLFRNLRRIELLYDYIVEGPSAYEPWANREAYPRETFKYRDAFFRKLLSALNHPDHPASKVNSLSVYNLQDWVNAETSTSDDFKALLGRLEELELYVASEEQHDEYEIRIVERHDFYSHQLRKYWLQPLQEIGRLTSLKLYGSIQWGYLPKCDLRGLHFPKLKNLALGNMNFTHDWQLEWMVSHASSLESLALHNCPIIPEITLVWEMDADGYPALPRNYPGTGRGRRVVSELNYDSRWHNYFHSFRTQLQHLRHFAVTNKGRPQYDGRPSAAARTFTAAVSWPAEIKISRYGTISG